jgi:hypothetical protein
MKLISHRGNLNGPNEERENHPDYIMETVQHGCPVEVDVWRERGQWMLGHDGPQYTTTLEFISHPEFYIHAKNLEALASLTSTDLHYFWHQEDDFTLTSKNFIWTYPGKRVTTRSIIVCQTKEDVELYLKTNAYGICADIEF